MSAKTDYISSPSVEQTTELPSKMFKFVRLYKISFKVFSIVKYSTFEKFSTSSKYCWLSLTFKDTIFKLQYK